MILTCYIIWIFYFILEGVREAYFWHHSANSNKQTKYNLHGIFTIQRILLFVLINIICLSLGKILILFDIALILSQPFFHNGMYYLIRNKIDKNVYNKKWLDQSVNSTAVLTKIEQPIVRVIFFILSLIIILILVCFNNLF